MRRWTIRWDRLDRRAAGIVALLAALALMLSACNGTAPAQQTGQSGSGATSSEASGAASGQSNANEEYVYLANVTEVPFWTDAKQALNDVAADLGVKTSFVGPTSADAQQEAQQLDQLIAKHPAGILIFPPDATTLKDGIDRAWQAGIPVITMIGDVPGSKRVAHIGIDNYQAGEAGAQLLCEAVGGKGKVVVGTFQAAGVLDRAKGYQDWLKANCPGVEVVQVVDDHADPSYAPQAYAAAIAAHPDLAGIGGTDGDSGLGAARAVIEANKKGQIKIVAMDRNDDMLPYIKDGTIYASVAQKTYTETYMAVQMLYLLNHNKLKLVSDWKAAGINPLPENVNTGIIPITKDNVDYFMHGGK
ncbi:MAG: substrate-binding domain-containing protein [Clostridia bacterium]|nr:substrate-binding domain-containing protein [Clostridia bacterium]